MTGAQKRIGGWTSVGLVAALTAAGAASHAISPSRYVSTHGAAVLQAAPGPQKTAQQSQSKKSGNAQSHKMGEWLSTHKDLPLDQQEKALENDPAFKRLPPDRQAALKERLRKFNNLTPEQRDLTLQRMNYFSSLSKEQRQTVRDANQKLQALPPDRRVAIHKALRHLRQMDPQQRAQTMQSDRFKSTFSDQEQGILKELADINPPPPVQNSQPGQSPK
ncbi:MAG TPA: DUF3106 domain-containing protein [Candidatus Angelobacter sp.]|jgi:hypothetical protein|nr:DUF3106 domain-containing protein [Candidatus Angelobacter sp.]